MRRAVVDPALSVRVLGARELHYSDKAPAGDDRPPHVRAASGLAVIGGRLAVVQDDTSFIALVGPGGALSIALPRGRNGRRRFEDALGNKQDKLDLESCVVIAGELWAFGSGSTPRRERVARVGDEVRLYGATALYAQLRYVIGGAINIEGVAAVGDELWLFHRGNTGAADVGPAVVRFDRARVIDALVAERDECPAPLGFDLYDLGTIDGVRLGFTDAIASPHRSAMLRGPAKPDLAIASPHRSAMLRGPAKPDLAIGGGERVFYLAAAERAANAVDDGPVLGSQLGVVHGDDVRCAPLTLNGAAIKAEGIAFDPHDPMRGWVCIDPDDTEKPAPLLAFELVGPW